ncbi:MAG TPA: tetratricopeptide repeat protein, partial [Chitinophagales bacterium]|nr:tetratricopeptide repeat protein [Chitinophagales bacterium]
MKKLLLLFIFAFAYESSFCRGEHVADSLINLLKNASEDSGKVQLQIAICNEKWKYGEYAEAKKYADAALTLSEKIGFRNGVGDAYYQTGIVFWYLKDNEKALDYHRQALSIYQQTGNKNGISHAYNRIGHDYADLPDYPRALEYFQKALELDQLLDNQLGITRNLDLIGFIYMNLSDYPRALTHYFQSLKLAEALNSKREISAACHDIAVVYEKQNRLEEALKYARRGLSLALQVGEKHLLDEAYSGLEKIYVKMGNYKEAFNARLKYDELESVLRNADNAGKIRQMQMQYDFEKREALVKAEEASKAAIARKELQQQELIINGFIGGFTIVLVFAGVVFIQRNKIRRG